jgi:hypothetical protein
LCVTHVTVFFSWNFCFSVSLQVDLIPRGLIDFLYLGFIYRWDSLITSRMTCLKHGMLSEISLNLLNCSARTTVIGKDSRGYGRHQSLQHHPL